MGSLNNSNSRKIRILHLVQDDKKFYESTIKQFDSDPRIENQCAMIVKRECEAFKNIPKTDRITVLWSRRQKRDYFSNSEYDVLFLHSFCPYLWPILKYVPKNKVVIWWMWGMDIYGDDFTHSSQLIPIQLYKPYTYRWLMHSEKFFFTKKIIKQLIRPLFIIQKKQVLSRIDYVQPVIREDYLLMRKYHKSFRANEFYPEKSITGCNNAILTEKKSDGIVLFGNSAVYTNNHLDVWNHINKFINQKQKVAIPLNYGVDSYAKYIVNSIRGENIVPLTEFMKRDEYFNLLNNCSYFVSGVLRQQSMGNISYCINTGIKVFLYKDSVVYNYLNKMGIRVFAIEDINNDSFSTPLSYEDAIKNREIYGREAKRRYNIYEDFISTMQQRLTKL